MNIVAPSPNEPFTSENGTMKPRSASWARAVTRLAMLEGSGSPEGVEEALPTRLYMNTAGTAGAILYIKRDADIAGDTTQGWVLV